MSFDNSARHERFVIVFENPCHGRQQTADEKMELARPSFSRTRLCYLHTDIFDSPFNPSLHGTKSPPKNRSVFVADHEKQTRVKNCFSCWSALIHAMPSTFLMGIAGYSCSSSVAFLTHDSCDVDRFSHRPNHHPYTALDRLGIAGDVFR